MFCQWDSNIKEFEAAGTENSALNSFIVAPLSDSMNDATNWYVSTRHISPEGPWVSGLDPPGLANSHSQLPAESILQQEFVMHFEQVPFGFWDKETSMYESPPALLESQAWAHTEAQTTWDDATGDDDAEDSEPPSTPSILKDIRASKPITKRTRKRDKAKKLQASSINAYENCHGQEVPPMLKTNCPAQERYILDLHWLYRHKTGKDMWTAIQSAFNDKFKTTCDKASLQMRMRRARSKYVVWLDKDEDILRQACQRFELERHQLMLDLFHAMGGSRNMRLCASDIKQKLHHSEQVAEKEKGQQQRCDLAEVDEE